MTLAWLLVVLYGVIFILKRGLTPKYYIAQRKNLYNKKLDIREKRTRTERIFKLLKAYKAALKVAGWIENILLTLLIMWLVYIVGALINGTFVVLGYPV